MNDIIEVAKNQSICGYPYYYIGDSAWFDEGDINEFGLQKEL